MPPAVISPGRNVRADEVGHEPRCGRAIQIARRALLHDLARLHHRDPVGEEQRLALIVRHVDRRDPEASLQLAQLDAHALAQLRVEVRQRLVEQQDLRAADQRSCEREPLLLPARELRRRALLEALESHERQGFVDHPLRLPVRRRVLADAKRERDVLEHRHVRPDRVRLEHHADVARVGRNEPTGPRQHRVVETDRAGLRTLEARDAPQRRRLPAARRPEEREEPAFLDGEGHVLDGAHATAVGDEGLAKRRYLQHRQSARSQAGRPVDTAKPRAPCGRRDAGAPRRA
jgi:hypothetical protein